MDKLNIISNMKFKNIICFKTEYMLVYLTKFFNNVLCKAVSCWELRLSHLKLNHEMMQQVSKVPYKLIY